MPSHPEVLWAQRSSSTDDAKNIIFLTVNLPDIQESTLKHDIQSTFLSFEARVGNAAKGIDEKDYAFKLDFYEEIIPEQSKFKLSSRALDLILRKKEKKFEFWPRLTKEKVKTPFIKTNFDRWVDEDEQEGTERLDDDAAPDSFDGGFGGGMDIESMMRQMGGPGPSSSSNPLSGAPFDHDDESESDDEGPPPLEQVEA